MRYKKISKEDVLKVIAYVVTEIGPCRAPIDIINVSNIANLLKTSRYQVKKYINELKADGLVELKMEIIPDDEEICPPYWGYGITDKGRKDKVFKEREELNKKIFSDWVNKFENREQG